MDADTRDYFDEVLDQVLPELPERVHRLLDDVPLVVDDYPSDDVLRRTRIRDRRHLCGLYTGIPLTERSIEYSGILSDVIHIYRLGILGLAATPDGRINRDELRRQIRITILHELGHHHGLGEDELRELGY